MRTEEEEKGMTLTPTDKLRIEVATLEERVKDLTFELNDRDYTIRELRTLLAQHAGKEEPEE